MYEYSLLTDFMLYCHLYEESKMKPEIAIFLMPVNYMSENIIEK